MSEAKFTGVAPRLHRQSCYRDRVPGNIWFGTVPPLVHTYINFSIIHLTISLQRHRRPRSSTTIYLACIGCKAYVASHNGSEGLVGIAGAEKILDGVSSSGPINFRRLDFAFIRSARRSAEGFSEAEVRLGVVDDQSG